MKHYRIVMTNKGSYHVQERFFFFFWSNLGEPEVEEPYEFWSKDKARDYIDKLKEKGQNKTKSYKVIEYH